MRPHDSSQAMEAVTIIGLNKSVSRFTASIRRTMLSSRLKRRSMLAVFLKLLPCLIVLKPAPPHIIGHASSRGLAILELIPPNVLANPNDKQVPEIARARLLGPTEDAGDADSEVLLGSTS